HDVYLKDGDSPSQARVMVQLIVPLIRSGHTAPDALAELYLDVTSQWQQLEMLQYLVIGTMIVTFTLIIGLLIYTTSRAEAIISKQHEVNLELTAAAAQAEAQSH